MREKMEKVADDILKEAQGNAIELYAFEDESGIEDSYTTFDAVEARQHAERYNLLWKALIYEYVEEQIVEDYRRETE